jgi:hypothetical protein
MNEGTRAKFLISPEEDLHFNRTAARILQQKLRIMQHQQPNMTVDNLARRTHAKVILIKRANGEREVLAGSHNFTSWTVRNGTRELAMWSKDPEVVDEIQGFLEGVEAE